MPVLGAGAQALTYTSLLTRRQTNEQFGTRDISEWLANLVCIQRGEHVLDVGCGDGTPLLTYAKKLAGTGEAVGLDTSEEALAALKRRASELGVQVTPVEGSMDNLFSLFAPSTFDLVSSCYSLYYSSNALLTLNHMKLLLSDRGRLLIVGPAEYNNREFYDFLRTFGPLPPRIDFIPSFVSRVVLPQSRTMFGTVSTFFFENRIHLPTADSFLQYWHASDVYSPKIEDALNTCLRHRNAEGWPFVFTKRAIGVLASL